MSPLHVFWSVGSVLAIAHSVFFANSLLAPRVTASTQATTTTPVSAGSSISVGECAINGAHSWDVVNVEHCKPIWKERPWLLQPYKPQEAAK